MSSKPNKLSIKYALSITSGNSTFLFPVKVSKQYLISYKLIFSPSYKINFKLFIAYHKNHLLLMFLYFLNFILMYLKHLQLGFLLYHIQVYDLQIIL